MDELDRYKCPSCPPYAPSLASLGQISHTPEFLCHRLSAVLHHVQNCTNRRKVTKAIAHAGLYSTYDLQPLNYTPPTYVGGQAIRTDVRGIAALWMFHSGWAFRSNRCSGRPQYACKLMHLSDGTCRWADLAQTEQTSQPKSHWTGLPWTVHRRHMRP